MAHKNEFKLTGNLVRDPKITKNATFIKLAINSTKKDKDGKPFPTDFFDVVYFGKDSHEIITTLKQGDLVTASGVLNLVPNKDKDGKESLIALKGLSIKAIYKKKSA